MIDADLAELVDEHGVSASADLSRRLRQRGLAGAAEAGQHR